MITLADLDDTRNHGPLTNDRATHRRDLEDAIDTLFGITGPFHPDDPAAEILDDDKTPLFDRGAALYVDSLISAAFEADIDVYEIALRHNQGETA